MSVGSTTSNVRSQDAHKQDSSPFPGSGPPPISDVQSLIDMLGGPHSAIELMSEALAMEGGSMGNPNADENTPGFCYLRLFDPVEHRDARKMGASPTVAELRRFSNGRADPFGTRGVNVIISQVSGVRLAHITLNSGTSGLRPVSALAALAKDCRVGHDTIDASVGLAVVKSAIEATRCRHEVLPGPIPPNDLPFNVPDVDRYPYSRYSGMHKFVSVLESFVARVFIADLGGNPNETQPEAFWDSAFLTSAVLRGYLKMQAENRLWFLQMVRWIQEPAPGRPGGVIPDPPEWPNFMPTPLHHTMSRYAGIAEWMKWQSEAWQVVCRLTLFGVKEPFDPVWWGDYHRTIDVYNMYAKFSVTLRDAFAENVYWIPDANPVNEERSRVEESVSKSLSSDGSGADGGLGHGYCYLILFRPERRSVIRRSLGKNPWAASVVSALLGQPNMCSGGTFALTVNKQVEVSGGSSFQQGHVYPKPGGLPVMTVVSLLVGQLRLGATSDLNALMNLQGADPIVAVPSVFPMTPVGGGPGVPLSFNIFAIVGKDTVKYPSVNFNLLREPAFSLLLGAFESVQLEKASFTVQVSTGSTNMVYAAICGPEFTLATLEDWLGAPINTIVHGSDQGYVDSTMVLPATHPFERELRAVSTTGNSIPTFRFSFSGAANGTGTIKGSFTVRVRGQYALGHVRVGGSTSTKSHVSRIIATLPQTVRGSTSAPEIDDSDDDEEESEDETEPAAPPAPAVTAVLPVRPNAAAPRANVSK